MPFRFPLRVPLIALLFLSPALAGCLGATEAPVVRDAALAPAESAPLELTTIRGVDRSARSLEAPPVWETGEWWRYRVTDLATGETSEVTKVVAGALGDHYVVGMPADAWDPRYLVYHLPGFTEVSRTDLSFEVHDGVFKPLQFPLETGASWSTGWHQKIVEKSGLQADVEVTGPTTARVLLAGPGGHIDLVYDALAGQITSFHMDGYLAWEVVDHGCCYEGPVRVALDHDVDILSIRGLLVVTNGLGPAGPIESVDVDTEHTHITLATVLYDAAIGGPDLPAQQGVAALRVQPPHGDAFEHVATPADGPGIKARYRELQDPSGTWTLQHLAAGNVATLAEGITYDAYVVTLPDGTVEPAD